MSHIAVAPTAAAAGAAMAAFDDALVHCAAFAALLALAALVTARMLRRSAAPQPA